MARRNQDRGEQMFKDAPASEFDWDEGSAGRSPGSLSASPKRDIIALRAPARETPPAMSGRQSRLRRLSARPSPPRRKPNPAAAGRARGKASAKPAQGLLRRHPVLAPVGLIALLLAAAAGYLYWDHSAHFESTDDAFIAARQFAIAPQVAGYVTAVPVTDNQHVDKGGVIAQIDQRDYRAALAQAEAQVAGGGSRHPQHRRADRDARRADRREPGASEPRRRRTWNSRRSPGDATSRSSIRDGRRLSRARLTSRLSRPSRPLWTARKRRSRWRSGKSTR